MTDTGRTSSDTQVMMEDSHEDEEDDDDNRSKDRVRGQASDRAENSKTVLLVVLGGSQTGKTSLCNKIVGEESFPVSKRNNSCAPEDREVRKTRYRQTFVVMDTHAQKRKDIQTLVDKLKKRLARYSNNVFFLFCVRNDARFAEGGLRFYQHLKAAWNNDEDLSKRLFVAFTDHGHDRSSDTSQEEQLLWDGDRRLMADMGSTHIPVKRQRRATEIESSKMSTQAFLQLVTRQGARKLLIFNNQMEEDEDVKELIDSVVENTPLLQKCWRAVAHGLKRHNQKGLFGMVLVMFLLKLTEVIIKNLDLPGNNLTTPFF